MVDFSKLKLKNVPPPCHPKELFAALNERSSQFDYLRDVQGQVLDTWYARRTNRDVVIKMNTGTGKTVVGLLALRSSINESITPALYVTPNNFLSDQVIAQASGLGIPFTNDPESTAYLSGESIGIINVSKLVNGHSIFGGPGNMRRVQNPTPIGALVIDDAHACLNAIQNQTTVTIEHTEEAYDRIMKLFKSDMKAQSGSRLKDLEDPFKGAIFRVPIGAWANKYSEVMEVLDDLVDDSEDWYWSWPFIRDILPSCQAIFSHDQLEIQPLCPPTNKIISLEDAKRRLYLTATLADDSLLITHFGISDTASTEPITPSSAADIGDRLILSPLELDSTINEVHIRDMLQSFASEYNVVVLVPSQRRSEEWKDYTERIVYADDIAQTVELLKSGKHVGLVVFVNKYDGIDLPNDACRILVLDGLPGAISNSGRREAEILGGSEYLDHLKLQWIEQGMGRGVRSALDYCVVLLLGPSLSTVLVKPQMRDKLGPATQAQLELSMSVASEIKERGIKALKQTIEQCLNRDKTWLAVSRTCLSGVTYGLGSIEPFSVAVRDAFVASAIGQYNEAIIHMREAINQVEDDKSKGWLKEQLATYMCMVDPVDASKDTR